MAFYRASGKERTAARRLYKYEEIIKIIRKNNC